MAKNLGGQFVGRKKMANENRLFTHNRHQHPRFETVHLVRSRYYFCFIETKTAGGQNIGGSAHRGVLGLVRKDTIRYVYGLFEPFRSWRQSTHNGRNVWLVAVCILLCDGDIARSEKSERKCGKDIIIHINHHS